MKEDENLWPKEMKYEEMEEDKMGDLECPIEALNVEEEDLWIRSKNFSG